MHFVNQTATYSKQRFQQLVIDDPLQYHFTFNWTQTLSQIEEAVKISEHVFKTANGQPAPVKLVAFPMDRNNLLLRLENIGDLFDYPSTATLADTVVYVDLQQLAKDIYFQANGAAIINISSSVEPMSRAFSA